MSPPGTPLLFVVGRMRVGKGEAISTLIKEQTGQDLDIASARMDSQTKCSARYPYKLGEIMIDLVDSVGYDDSDGDEKSTAAFLEMLAETGKEPFYPPLVVLRELSGTDKVWLQRIQSVFPFIVCACRCKKKSFPFAKESFDEHFPDVQLFHINEFVDEDVDDGKTRRLYVKDLERIVAYYAALTPSREDLDFDAKLFQGKLERVAMGVEKKTETRIEQELFDLVEDRVVKREKIERVQDGGHFEEREVPRSDIERWSAAAMTLLALGAGGWNPNKTVNEWVPDHKDVVVDDSSVEKVTVHYLRITEKCCHFEREIEDEWKVLAGGMRIFRRNVEGEWKLTKEDIVDVRHEKVSSGDASQCD